jgi:acyl-coenzyme A thioesterase PaaI-like protein
MKPWSRILDDSVAGCDEARHLHALRLPMLAGWAPGRVWARWPVATDLLTPIGEALFGGYVAALTDHMMATSTSRPASYDAAGSARTARRPCTVPARRSWPGPEQRRRSGR